MSESVPTLTGSGPSHSVSVSPPCAFVPLPRACDHPAISNVEQSSEVLEHPAEVPLPAVQTLQSEDEVDDDPDDYDSAFGDGKILQAQQVRHHLVSAIIAKCMAEPIITMAIQSIGKGPNDDTQNEQLDIGHHMCTLILDNKLYLAPIGENIQKVLDIGTGTRIWAIDFADMHPSASVIGTDISPIQPTWVPPNLKFEIDDAQREWTFADTDFDFIYPLPHGKHRQLAFTVTYKRAFTATKPGGFIEHFDMDIQFTSDDGTIKEGDTMYEWSKVFIDAGEKMGRTFTIARDSKRLLEEAGFVDVVEKKYKIPVGAWMADKKWKEIGRWDLLYLTAGLEGMALYILKHVLGWEFVEIQVYVANMRRALLTKGNHVYYEITVVYGRKPESSTD